jgi:hypothetical protein
MRRLSPTKRQTLWSREATNAYLDGRGRFPICNLCDLPVTPGQDWDESHAPEKPRCFGGRRVGIAHLRCNREHGAQVVTPAFAASNRKQQHHIGADGPGLGKSPMRAGRRSQQSKTFRHGVVTRLTQVQKHALFMKGREIIPEGQP